MRYSVVVALLFVPTLLAIVVGLTLLRNALSRSKLLVEEVAFAAAWIFVLGSFVWLGVFLADSSLLGFRAPWTWLAAAHFAFAGFGALTMTAFSCRAVSNMRALKVLRLMLLAHPIAYLVTAAGISGVRYCDELGATTYALIFVTQCIAVAAGNPNRLPGGPRRIVLISLGVPVVTMVPALAWAWGHPIFDMRNMIQYHGLVNALGHVGLGFAGFLWGRPKPHGVNKDAAPGAA